MAKRLAALVAALLLPFAATADALRWHSSSVLVMDPETHEVLVAEGDQKILPIASVTKLMTAMVMLESGLPLNEMVTIEGGDVDRLKGSSSRLPVGTRLTKEQLLRLALMSSENRAAHALGRTYPGGMRVFVSTMNSLAKSLGMTSTSYVEPTGLSSLNTSTARDLAILVAEAGKNETIRQFTTAQSYAVKLRGAGTTFGTTNALLSSARWDIELQKTGYIQESGRCMVLLARFAGRTLVTVLLHAPDSQARAADAETVRRMLLPRLDAVVRTPKRRL